MNIVLYAGDSKYYKTLLPIALEVKRRGHDFLFLYSEETQLKYPHEKEYFSYDGSFSENKEYVVSQTLGVEIPFKPDILILARERWQPEQSIIHEFKEKFGCKIGLVEVSSHLINNIENRLEMLSRMSYPQNMIDYYFEHSEFAKERRIDCMNESYRDKIKVVGNPRFSNIKLNGSLEKYNIDLNKKQILFWGVINTTRDTSFKALKTLVEKTKDTHQVFYKCYPGEPTNPKFINQFNPFVVDGVQIIYDENDVFDIANLCDIHIGQMSSVFNFAFYFDKTIVNLDSVCHASDKMNDINTFINETGNGVEDSAKFWMNIWKIPTIEDFKKFVDIDRLQKFNQTNLIVMDIVKENTINFDWDCEFLSKSKKDYSNLIKLFDEYKLDGNASIRILDFLENETN
jgi:hypothetical protein